MADFRPFRALRYDTTVAGDPATLVSPPFDVVTPEEARALYERNPYNVSRIDFGEMHDGDSEADNRYTRARRDLNAWRKRGVLRVDAGPRLYVYDQEFELDGVTKRRRAVFGRLRLEDWDSGVVLPHEHTRPRDKADRLQLLQATGVNLSPIMALYPGSSVSAALTEDAIEAPVFDAALPGERHTLRPLRAAAAGRFQEALRDERLYIADGHHRYETALAYRDERCAAASHWKGDEPENYVLAALIDVAEPGLVVLPIHRLLQLDALPDPAALEDLVDTTNVGDGEAALGKLTKALSDAAPMPAFGLISRDSPLQLLRVKDRRQVEALLPSDRPNEWRALDVAILHGVLLPRLGFTETPDNVAFTEDAGEAYELVQRGDWDAAVLVNPTRVDQIIAVADGGERMPQKSTFFYPKLGTGIVMLPLDLI
jgi:uncharacterized protein (DUF1015 family)